MHIAIDASRTTVKRVTGTEHYARQLTHHLIQLNDSLDQPHQISLYFRDEPATDLFPNSPNVRNRVIPFPRLWTHLRFAHAIWQDRPDVTFVPSHTLPIAFRGKSIVTVHDLGFRYFPHAHPTVQRFYLDATTGMSQARADIVLADSQATAADLHKFYGTSPEKIRVIYPGVDQLNITNRETIRQKYELPDTYFLFLGTLQPRKNIKRIIQAFTMWKQQTPSDIALVLAGGKGWLFDETWLQGTSDVILTGYIDEVDKGALYAESLGLVFPTLYEGFGFPVIEAMHCHTPVIASNTSSLPELVGEAGLLVDPEEVTAIANAMDKLYQDVGLRQSLIQKGIQQAQKFTWEQTAQQTWSALQSLA